MQYDVIIIGAGIVGLATARQLQRKRPDWKITVLEKENAVASHQSSHNSGVIHSGIYYKPGGLRALNCKRGYAWMLEFCQEQDIPHDICGKIIVAADESERERLENVYQRGLANGLDGIRKISGAEARAIEPHIRAVEAIWVPQTGIVDFGVVAARYAQLFESDGGQIHLKERVKSIIPYPNSIVVEAAQKWECRFLVNCAGLYSDEVTRQSGLKPDIQIIPFRGEYFELKPEAQSLVRNLIYPVPNINFPFLGVHFTRMIQGGIEAGPNAVLAFKREGYSRWDFNALELSQSLAFKGFRKMAARYWRDGWLEMQRSYSKRHFVKALQHLVPDISSEGLEPGRSGVRAMACDSAGNVLDDFLFLESPRMLHVCNAPSPAATASLSVGETVAQKVVDAFQAL